MDKKVMTVVWQYGLVLVHVCYTITIYASADKKGNAKLLFHKNARFGEMLFAISDKRVAEEHSALYQKRAELDRPQSSIQNHILSLDDNIRYAYKKRVFVNEQLEGYCAKKAALRKAEEDLIINIEKLQKDKEFIARRMGGYGNELKEVQDAEDELCSIEMSSVSKQLAHCQNRIALMCKRKDELRKEVGPLSFNICSLEKEREQWDAYSAELQAKRAELVQIQMICFNDGTRPLLDQFDEMIELSIASAYICPINIFTQLAIKTGDARECAWCFALLKVFQSKDPTYQQIMQHVQNKKRYCDEQDKCTLCDSLNEKRAKVLSKIAKHCLQQLKHDKVYRVCLGCSDSLIKTENLLRKKAFVDYVEQIVPDYIAFRLDYLELFLKHDVKLNIYSKFSSQLSQIIDLLLCYSNHMEDLKDLLDDKSNLHYLKMSVKNMDDAYSAFDGFLTRKKLAERTTELLTQAQMQIERILSDLNPISYQSSSSSSSSSSSLSSSDD